MNLRKSQFYAMMSRKNAAVGWGVNYSALSSTLTLYQGSSYLTRNPSFDERFIINSSVSINPEFDISFTRVSGVPTRQPPAVVTISGLGTSKKIGINSEGVATR